MVCIKCGSKVLIPVEHPHQNKGMKCMICGKEMWYDQVDMYDYLTRHESMEVDGELIK